MKSVNILTIYPVSYDNTIDTVNPHRASLRIWEAVIHLELKMYCPVIREVFHTMNIKARGKGYNVGTAFISALEKLEYKQATYEVTSYHNTPGCITNEDINEIYTEGVPENELRDIVAVMRSDRGHEGPARLGKVIPAYKIPDTNKIILADAG